MRRKSAASVKRASSAIVPASSTPVGPGADDDEAQQPLAARRVGLHLGRFECAEDSPPDRRRVVDRLQPRRVRLPVVVAEIRMRGARRDDEVIERQRAVADLDDAPRRVDGRDFAEQHRRVALPAQDGADRPCDVGRRQAGRRDLIEQRLEQVIVVPVDDRDVGVDARERLRGEQAAESCADDDDARARHSRSTIADWPIWNSILNLRKIACDAAAHRAAQGVACVLQLTRPLPAPRRRGFLVNHGGESSHDDEETCIRDVGGDGHDAQRRSRSSRPAASNSTPRPAQPQTQSVPQPRNPAARRRSHRAGDVRSGRQERGRPSEPRGSQRHRRLRLLARGHEQRRHAEPPGVSSGDGDVDAARRPGGA